MLIKYNGPKVTTRHIGGVEWSSQAGYSQSVTDPDLLEDLLTYPGDQFGPDPGDPIVEAIGADAAAMVGLSGISTLAIQATLTDREIGILADAVGVDRITAAGWAVKAQDAGGV